MDLWNLQIPVPFVLAVVATLAYIFGRRSRTPADDVTVRSRRELRRAQLVAAELEKIAWTLRKGLAQHHASVSRFRQKVGRLSDQQEESAWKELCNEAEEILRPTLQLASQLAGAYDEIRQQSANLMTFTEVRTDPLTLVGNRRGLDDALSVQFALQTRYQTPFAIALFDIDHFKAINDQEGHLQGDRILQTLSRLINDAARETDVVARYGGEEFVVVMPQTELAGASIFAERLRRQIANEMPLTISGGVAEALAGDTQDTLFARADMALYQAKTAGRNCIFRHDGQQVESVVLDEAAAELVEQ